MFPPVYDRGVSLGRRDLRVREYLLDGAEIDGEWTALADTIRAMIADGSYESYLDVYNLLP